MVLVVEEGGFFLCKCLCIARLSDSVLILMIREAI